MNCTQDARLVASGGVRPWGTAAPPPGREVLQQLPKPKVVQAQIGTFKKSKPELLPGLFQIILLEEETLKEGRSV